jgi:hypothetical protein
MRHVVKAVSITAGGLAVAWALGLGLTYGLLSGIVVGPGLDPTHEEDDDDVR